VENHVMLLDGASAWDAVAADVRGDLGEVGEDDSDALTAALLRRAASARCPCPRGALVDALVESLAGLAPDAIAERGNLNRILDELLATGDLIELGHDGGLPLIFVGPPRYVLRRETTLVMGGLAETGLPLSPELRTSLASRHAYRLLLESTEETEALLRDLGFFEYPMDAWTSLPELETPASLLHKVDDRLAVAARSGDIPELTILDRGAPVANYRARWCPPSDQTGRYVGRRPQKWGAPRWCVVEVDRGLPVCFIDLPAVDGRFRACDEAWWIQFAMDALDGHAQELGVGRTIGDRRTVSVRMPLPEWAVRRLLLAGDLTASSETGYLFSYAVWLDELDEEVRFLKDRLWVDVRVGMEDTRS
jgi:hypothetical protein